MSTGFAKPVEGLIIARDLGCCARCGKHVAHLERGREWSIHHRRPRGGGGTSLEWVNLPANGLVLCGSGTTGCHSWVESNRREARELGFLVSLNGRLTADEVSIVHAVLGHVLLDNHGGFGPIDEGPTPDSIWKEAA